MQGLRAGTEGRYYTYSYIAIICNVVHACVIVLCTRYILWLESRYNKETYYVYNTNIIIKD